jgi:dipeptidyl aminopeptidase/acylaminoacyl peptidase
MDWIFMVSRIFVCLRHSTRLVILAGFTLAIGFSPQLAVSQEDDWGIAFWLSRYGEFGGDDAASGFYWMSEDGTELFQLLSYAELVHTGNYYSLSDVSPDGQQVLYMSPPRGTPPEILGDIYVFNIAAGEAKQIISEGGQGNTEPAWSPDGRNIALLYGDGIRQHGSHSLGILDLQNHTISTILNVQSEYEDNSLNEVYWSADSKTLAITGTREIFGASSTFSDFVRVIWIYGIDGTYFHEIPRPDVDRLSVVSLHDENLYIAYGDASLTEIATMNILSRKFTPILNVGELALGIKRFSAFSVHPEQDLLAVAVTNRVGISRSTGRERIFLYNMETGEATELRVPEGNISSMRWMRHPAHI